MEVPRDSLNFSTEPRDAFFFRLNVLPLLYLVIMVQFSVNEGVPVRVFGITMEPDPHIGWWLEGRPIRLAQVTRYAQYEDCAPTGAPAEFCVCE